MVENPHTNEQNVVSSVSVSFIKEVRIVRVVGFTGTASTEMTIFDNSQLVDVRMVFTRTVEHLVSGFGDG